MFQLPEQQVQVEKGINLEVIWFDGDLIEVTLACSNGYFSGRADVYLGAEDLSTLAKELSGFPSRATDSREIRLGTFDPSHADGGALLRFYCRDSVGHAVVEIKLRGSGCEALGEMESVSLRIPIEPAAVDSFVRELTTIERAIGANASLPMAT